MPKLYSVEIMIAATVYVEAESPELAAEQVRGFHMDTMEIPTGEYCDGLPVSGTPFDSEDLPEISMSPAMTIYAENLTASLVE